MQKRIPLLMMGSALANAQSQPQLTQETPFTNLKGSSFQMYNQTGGSTSTIHFNPDGIHLLRYMVMQHQQLLLHDRPTGTLIILVGEELGVGSIRRKYCSICEIYFGLCVELIRCPCCSNVLRCPLKTMKV